MKINYKYLPLKAHYFFFMATMGAMIPFLPVYGKQLGVSAIIMSSITVATYLLFVIFKPVFGLLTDYFHTQKKFIFMSVLVITSGFFILLYFLPLSPERTIPNNEFKNISCSFLSSCDYIDDVSRLWFFLIYVFYFNNNIFMISRFYELMW
ncbi:hypothetical protein PUN28_004497 [Cardiocondyla obscurior]|uniref:Major facilitator superfamily associated domain-containing protein n=1 Tax=Cardiocondyla obscurior TaxID=286306 RepID=A0AAW2GBK9_9HYME